MEIVFKNIITFDRVLGNLFLLRCTKEMNNSTILSPKHFKIAIERIVLPISINLNSNYVGELLNSTSLPPEILYQHRGKQTQKILKQRFDPAQNFITRNQRNRKENAFVP